jgi:hypothetical protein
MTSRSWWCVAVAAAFAANTFADVASTNDFDKYKVIMDKSPFRKTATATPVQAQPVIQGLALKGITSDSRVAKAWITDTKTGKTYYVAEGEKAGECTVGKIDAEAQTVELTAGVQKEALKFPEKTAGVPMPQAAVAPVTAARAAYRGPLRPVNPAPTPPPVAPAPANPTALNAPAASGTAPVAPAPTSLRRRILRQQVQANPAAAAPPAEAPQPAAEEPAEQPAEEAPAP